MISVVIPLYNKAAYIKATIESVLAQSFQDFEIVVVDDGSTDGGAEIVEAIGDRRIRVIHQENGGVSVARNRGIEESKYEWIALLDGDDIWKRDYLQTQWNLHLKYPECDVCASNYEFCNHKGEITPTKINKLPFDGDDGVLTNYFEVASCSHPPICSITIMARRSAFLAIGGFPVGVKSGEDLLTWARLAVRFQICYTRLVGSVYNLEEDNPATNRTYDNYDFVGESLVQLCSNHINDIPDLRLYVALWYKMKAVVYVRRGDRLTAIKYALRSLRYNVFNVKLYAIILIALLPVKLK